MSILDGDGERLKSGGNVAARDIVQVVLWSLGWAHDDDLRNTLAPSTFHVPMMKLESYLFVKSILTKLSQTVIVICSVNFK